MYTAHGQPNHPSFDPGTRHQLMKVRRRLPYFGIGHVHLPHHPEPASLPKPLVRRNHRHCRPPCGGRQPLPQSDLEGSSEVQGVLGPPCGRISKDDRGRRQRIPYTAIHQLTTITAGGSARRLPCGGLGVPQDETAGASGEAEGEEGRVGLRAVVGLRDRVVGRGGSACVWMDVQTGPGVWFGLDSTRLLDWRIHSKGTRHDSSRPAHGPRPP